MPESRHNEPLSLFTVNLHIYQAWTFFYAQLVPELSSSIMLYTIA
jgi:hypothetical protein